MANGSKILNYTQTITFRRGQLLFIHLYT